MSFHSKDNQYIIDQIVFYDENSHTTYKLGNSQGTMNYYSWYKYKNKKASNQNRLGDFELMFFNSKQTLEKNPKEKDIKVEQETCDISSDKSKIYVHYVNKENNIKLNIFIDTPSIVLDSLKDRFILMFSFVQIILACIYFIYTYLENEREELNKTRNLFINAMAHEMKTPNAVILNSSEMLIENVNPEKQHKYLKMIEDESKHMNNLLNQMLIYTRTTNSYQLHKQNHNLSTMFEEVLKHYDLESKIITIDIDSKINISCDQQLMMIVFDNLINNAFKYANQKISIVYKQEKIKTAVSKANKEVDEIYQLNQAQITAIANNVTKLVEASNHAVSVEDIQNMVEKEIMAMRGYEVAQKYVRYRYKREIARKSNTTDERILSIIGLENEEVKQENANKNPTINSTQRDYMAGEVSKDLTTRILLPEDIVKAHNEGIIHFHESIVA